MTVVFLLEDFAAQPGHIHVRRALAEAALAGQAAVEDFGKFGDIENGPMFAHGLAVLEDFAFKSPCKDFAEDVCTGPGGTGLVLRHLVCRAHGAADKVRLETGSGSVALLHRAHQGMRLRAYPAGAFNHAFVESRPPIVIGPAGRQFPLHGVFLSCRIAHPFIHGWGVHYLVHVEHPVRIPALLDIPHQLVYRFAVHQRDELSAEPAVAMFPAEAPLVTAYQKGRLPGDVAEEFPSFGSLKVEQGPQMQFPGTDVSVEHTSGMQAGEHLPEILHIGREALRGHGRILDHAGGLVVSLHPAQDTEARLPQVPYLCDVIPVYPCAGIGKARSHDVSFERIGHCIHGFTGIRLEFSY